jgi:signal transduction histidine kinase
VVAELDRHDGVLELDVTDTGAGMSEEAVRRATDLFFTTKPQGSGIGLALIAQLVARDHGNLEISSQPGRGTRVSLRVREGGEG